MVKMNDDERVRNLLKVAHAFYDDEKSKTDISHEIKSSVTQVSRLLKDARHEKLVRVEYSPPPLLDLAIRLEERYRWLQKAIVIQSVQDLRFQRQLLAQAAAEYFEEIVRPSMKIGVGGGYTTYEMIKALPERERDIDIYPTALIGRGPVITHIDPLVLVTLLWAKSGNTTARAHSATVLPFEPTDKPEKVRKDYQKYLKDRAKIRNVFEGMKKAEAIFCSIGSIIDDQTEEKNAFESTHSTINLLAEMSVTEDYLRKEGVYGDINYSYFDQKGNTTDKWNFFLTLDVNHLRQMVTAPNSKSKVIVIVGRYKKLALKAAVEGKLCNVLIIDADAARFLLDI